MEQNPRPDSDARWWPSPAVLLTVFTVYGATGAATAATPPTPTNVTAPGRGVGGRA